jgi:predicted nicotinamide N-methyase
MMKRGLIERTMRSGSVVMKIATLSQAELTNFDSLGSVGGTLWPSAKHLITYFENSNHALAGKSVLELGSGCGYCGIALAALGARRVSLTDLLIKQSRLEYDMEGCLIQNEVMVPNRILLDLCQHNIDVNKSITLGCEMGVNELEWGEQNQSMVDKCASPNEPFDLIVGSDLTYHPQATEALFWTVSYLLRNSAKESNKSTTIPKFIAAHQQRRESSTNFALDCAKKAGLGHTILHEGDGVSIWEFSASTKTIS